MREITKCVQCQLTFEESAEHTKWRQMQLMRLLEQSESSLTEDHLPLRELLAEYHNIFSIEDDERGETDMIEFEICTGDEALGGNQLYVFPSLHAKK